MAKVPANFNGAKFQAKYNLTIYDFRQEGTDLIVPSLPNLVDADLLDCVNTPAELAEMEAQKTNYETSKAEIIAQYQAAILRLKGYQTATPPFTQAGYTALINANKDMAQILEKILKVTRRII